MEYKDFDKKTYQIHTIKTNRFKTTKIEVYFRMPINREKLSSLALINEIQNNSNKTYNSKKNLAIKLEDLYAANYMVDIFSSGGVYSLVYVMEYIDENLINEKDYLENIIKFLCDMILNPNVKNNEFDITDFNNAKKKILLEIDSLKENPEKISINNALELMDDKYPVSWPFLGTKEEINKITPESLYNEYLNMINNSIIDIFVIGNSNMESINNLFSKYFNIHNIRNQKLDYFMIENSRNKVLKKEENGPYVQTSLVAIYNLNNLTSDEMDITFAVFNYIFGNGGLTSKLYQYIREQNSYCYGISSLKFRFDNLLVIRSSLDYENVNNTIKLIGKALKEMQEGIFTDEDIEVAKKSLLMSLKLSRNNKDALLANYEFQKFINGDSYEEKMDKLLKVTKEDIIKVSSKIKLNTIYVLKEDTDERN